MPFVRSCTCVLLALLAITIIGPSARAGGGECANPSIGPDVIVAEIAGWSKFGTVGGVSAYAIGATSTNIGDQELPWWASANQHPVIATNAYRLKNGRFEQIGMSWLKHGWGALTQSINGCTCIDPKEFEILGVGCSDPYDSGLNGDQDGIPLGGGWVSGLGARFEVNAHTGEFNWPYFGYGLTGNAIYKRLQIHLADLDPAQNPNATYFAEVHYVTPQDAAAGNNNNNASHRRFNVGALQNGSYTLSFPAPPAPGIQRKTPAIQAWKNAEPTVGIQNMQVPDDGRLILAQKVTYNGDGTWHYEFALQNLNSHRSVGSFSVPIPSGVNVTNIGFHDVDYHSGEPYDLTDWPGLVASGALTWATIPFATNQNANALRWGAMYNFRFDADGPPFVKPAALELFRPGSPASLAPLVLAPVRLGDVDGSGQVNVNDLLAVISAWGPCPAPPAPCPTDVSPPNGDGQVNVNDLLLIIANWG